MDGGNELSQYVPDSRQWEGLAYDIVLSEEYGIHTVADVLKSYRLTSAEYRLLLGNADFKRLLDSKRAEVQGLGSGAPSIVAMRVILSKSLPLLHERLRNPDMTDRDFHAIFKLLVDGARLAPVQAESTGAPSVVFTIQGIPGLEHTGRVVEGEVTPSPAVTEVVEVVESRSGGEELVADDGRIRSYVYNGD